MALLIGYAVAVCAIMSLFFERFVVALLLKIIALLKTVPLINCYKARSMVNKNDYPSDKMTSFQGDLAMIADHLGYVREIINHAQIAFAEVYVLPDISKDDEKQRMRLRRQFVDGVIDELEEPPFSVKTVTGEAAVEKMLAHYEQYRVPPDMSSWYAKRLPGLICVQTENGQELVDHIARINALKLRLHDIAKTLDKDVEKRWEYIHQAVPGFCSASAYRQIQFVPHTSLKIHEQPWQKRGQRQPRDFRFERLYSVRFNFEHRQSIKNYTYDDLLARLEGARPFAASKPGMLVQVEREIARVLELDPKTRFKQKRPMPATPIFKVRGYKAGDDKKSMGSGVAHSPIICINLEPPRIKSPLGDYSGRVIIMPPADDPDAPVVRRLHMYRA
ncbi:hypothetical protein C9975_04620 [Thalassospira xiamenensis]|nr:hypothetical protein C9975_04620 [Thalassospira xiamenensis]